MELFVFWISSSIVTNQAFNTENIIDQDDENVSMERLEEEFAKKFNSRMFNDYHSFFFLHIFFSIFQ